GLTCKILECRASTIAEAYRAGREGLSLQEQALCRLSAQPAPFFDQRLQILAMLRAHSSLPVDRGDDVEESARVADAPSEQHPGKAGRLAGDRRVVNDQEFAGILGSHEPFVPASASGV